MDSEWSKLNGEVEEVALFARRHYPNFWQFNKRTVYGFFETYRDTTLVHKNKQGIDGILVYQEWPDLLNFIIICLPFGTKLSNFDIMCTAKHLLPDKKVVWFDEKRMKLRGQ